MLEYLHFCQSSYNKYSRKPLLKGHVDQERVIGIRCGRVGVRAWRAHFQVREAGSLLERLLGKLHGPCHHRDVAELLEGPISGYTD